MNRFATLTQPSALAPLRAILREQPDTSVSFYRSPYLRALFGKENRARLYSFTDLKALVKRQIRPLKSLLPDDTEKQTDWYQHYE